MIEGLEAITTASLSAALDATVARHQVIATNIRNANVDGYVPQRLDFDAFVQSARNQLQDYGRLDSASVEQLSSTPLPIDSILSAAGQPASVKLDVEAGNMAQNSLQYQALLAGISHHLSLLSAAVSDGKR